MLPQLGMFISFKTEENTRYTKINFREIKDLNVIKKKESLEENLELKTVPTKLGKEYVKAVYCRPAYLTYMQSISCKMPT